MQKKFELRTLIILALFAAIGAVFKAFVSVDLFFGGMKISDVSPMALPILLAGLYFGPLAGGLVGFISEFVGFVLSPVGGYNPVFSVIAALVGVMAGMFSRNMARVTLWKAVALVVLTEVVCSGVLTTLAVHLFFGVPMAVLLPTRGVGLLIKIPVLSALLVLLAERLRPVMRRHSVRGAV